MAEKRMFAKSIVLSDAFLDMPMSSRCLYFTLSMMADDDGFVNNPKSIMRQCGASEDDMSILISKKFVLVFESGVIVIKHWRINNYLRNDRYTETNYKDEKSQLTINGGIYTKNDDGIPPGIPSIDKNSIDKYSIDTICSEQNVQSQEVIITFPLKSGFRDITQDEVNEWIKLYPKVNVMQELNNMKGWLDANPSKRKTKTGIKRFVNGWLSRAQERTQYQNESQSKIPDYLQKQKDGLIKDTKASAEQLARALELQRKLSEQ